MKQMEIDNRQERNDKDGLDDLPKLAVFLGKKLHQIITHYRLRRHGVRLSPSTAIIGKCEISGDVEIGEGTIISESFLDGRGGLTIGRNVLVGRATIITAGHNLDSGTLETIYAPVAVGDFAVLFMGSTVLPGCKIGRGAVIGAGAVVTRDVPDMAVVAGNPATLVRYRKVVHTDANLLRMVGLAPRRLHDLAGKIRSMFCAE